MAVTVKVPAVPTAKVVESADVMDGAWSTVSVKSWVAFGLTPLAAVMVIGYVPPVPAAGVPDSTSGRVRDTPLGRVPVSVNVEAGVPMAVDREGAGDADREGGRGRRGDGRGAVVVPSG